ncbi:protein of unknown function [Gordonia malaquae]|uniref:DUF4307 domain-containing protein n=1 Tax=Gordonia malaquae NBRC 108250 TaxID=1223542 RepID=M3VG26_GORML|nr:DUF4307 domain-containing protein [Gordonia malaquae]GAC80569.1 hypothetical protein GM1_019_00310 [Gordonia malaquae NBRC 108250]SEC10400.1 protein of unknown function [Gordonia malaquae]
MSSSDGGSVEPGPAEDKSTIPRSGPRATYPVEQSSSSKKRWFYALSALVVVAGVGLAYAGYTQFADPEVSGSATAFEILSSDTVSVQYTVNRSNPDEAVACVVRARAQDGAEVGRREVLIPAGGETQVGAKTEVLTSRPAVIGEVFGCTATVPPYLKPAA